MSFKMFSFTWNIPHKDAVEFWETVGHGLWCALLPNFPNLMEYENIYFTLTCACIHPPDGEGKKTKLCLYKLIATLLLPVGAVIHCEDRNHQFWQCVTRRIKARNFYQGTARRPHRNQNHNIRILRGKSL